MSATAFASSLAGPQSVKTQDPSENPDPNECGQSCLYQRANENIALQAIHVINKLSDFEKLVATAASDDDWDRIVAMIRREGFLPDGQQKESRKDFYLRYRRAQLATLYKIRAALIENGDASAQLITKQMPADMKAQMEAEAENVPVAARFKEKDEKDKNKPQDKANLPYVPTTADLQKYHKPGVSQAEYATWIGEIQLRPEDFRKTTHVLRNPKEGKDKVEKVLRAKDGTKVSDEKTFKDAVSKLEGNSAKALEEDKKKMLDAKVYSQVVVGSEHDPKYQADLKTRLNSNSITNDAWQDARRILVDAANKRIKGDQGAKDVKVPPKAGQAQQGQAQQAQQQNQQTQPSQQRIPANAPAPEPTIEPPKPGSNIGEFHLYMEPSQIVDYIDETLKP